MQKKWVLRTSILLAALGIAMILAQAALAGSFHFTNVEFQLGSLVMTGNLAGLGDQTAKVILTGYGTVQARCQNQGGQQAPGRNPIFVNTQRTDVFVTDQYGHALVQVAAPNPNLSEINPSPTPKQAGCPNGNWTVVDFIDRSMNWTSATVVVEDASGTVQLNLSFTCTTFFTNGENTNVECVEN